MTQLGIGVAALNHDSVFQKAYETGIKKSDYWTYTLEDCLTLIARLPALAARIYRNVYRNGAAAPPISKDLDLVGNYTALMGYGPNKDLTEYLRLYISIHGDHEGGNASAHTARKVSVVMRVSPSSLSNRRPRGFDISRPIPCILRSALCPGRAITWVSRCFILHASDMPLSFVCIA